MVNQLTKGNLIWAIFSPDENRDNLNRDRVDYKSIRSFEKVEKGQTLLSFLPDDSGETTQNEVAKFMGRNISLSDDSLSLLSDIDGYAYFTDNRLNVDIVYHIEGDVNFQTGNVRFDGPVVIKGDVLSGFRVEATGNIEISGNVGASEVYSQKGSIVIKKGIVGLGRAKVLAAKDIFSGFIQDANIGAKGNIEVEKYIINSDVSSGGHINVTKDEGVIRGGSLFAKSYIKANTIGSENQIRTEIKVSGKSENPLHSEMKQIMAELEESVNTYHRLEKQEEFLLLLKKRLKKLSPEKNKELDLLKTRKELMLAKQGRIEEQLNRIRSKSIKKSVDVKVTILDTLYPDVLFVINDIELHSDDTFNNVSVIYNDDSVQLKYLGGENLGE